MQLFAGAAAPNAAGDADIIKEGSIQTFARGVGPELERVRFGTVIRPSRSK